MTQERMPEPLTPEQRMQRLIERLVYGRVTVLFTYTYKKHVDEVLQQLKMLPGAKYIAGSIAFKNGSRAFFMRHSSQSILTMRYDERYSVFGGTILWE